MNLENKTVNELKEMLKKYNMVNGKDFSRIN